MDPSCHTRHTGVTQCRAGWAQGWALTGSFLPVPEGHCGIERWRLGRKGEGSRHRQEPQVHCLCPCHQWLEEVGPQHLYWVSLPQPLRYLALGVWGAGFCWGVFPGHPQRPQMAPEVGLLPRCVGRGGGLDNLKFSTLTPFFVSKEGVGLLPKVAGGLDPLALVGGCSGKLDAGPSQGQGQSPGWLSRIYPPPLWQEHSQVTWPH